MKILVVNAGSSSLKYQLFDMDERRVLAKGLCEKIGLSGAVTHKRPGKATYSADYPMPTHDEAIALVLRLLTDPEWGVIDSVDEITAVGHRFAHGGKFTSSRMLGEEEMKYLESIVPINPLHGPPAIKGVNACRKLMGNTPMVGVFDTSFYATLEPKAYVYALPYEWFEQYGIRRYGFHGTSHRYVSLRAAEILGRDPAELKVVSCHLGNGSSLAAVKGGRCVDTSMGLTPLAGLPMGTRAGDMDVGVVEFIANKYDMTISEAVNLLNKESGMLGLSGVSSDFRDLEQAAEKDHHRATVALEIFEYRVRKMIAEYAAAMGGVDVVVFTAGVGENAPETRAHILQGLEFMGITCDPEKNNCRGKEQVISQDGAPVIVMVVPTNEELMIAQDTMELVLDQE